MLKLTNFNLDQIDEGLYDLIVSYCSLRVDKEMSDGVVFEVGTRLRILSPTDEEGLFFVETLEGDKNLFWVSDWEIDILEEKRENISSDELKRIRKFILNDFL